MNEKIKELIAIGASITAHCQPCLKFHVEQAIKQGATSEEIIAAAEVGKTVEKGALKAMDEFTKEQMDNLDSLKGTACSGCCSESCCSV